jgi:pyruvate,water dikinase
LNDLTKYQYVRRFGETTDVEVVGGKAASLSRMAASGMPVPPGHTLTAQAYRDHLAASELEPAIAAELAGRDPSDYAAQASVSARIQSMITEAPLPTDVVEEARNAYRTLTAAESGPIPVSVRSSATAEDLPGASFAGQHDTYLNVGSEQDMLRAVIDCWASLWSVHAIMYREAQNIAHHDVAMPVVVQHMLDPTVSGVAFTVNPVTADATEIVINSCWGLGEAVVSGIVNPDHIVVSKENLAVAEFQVANKNVMVVRDGNQGTKQVSVAVASAKAQAKSLSEEQITSLCEMASTLEASYGAPQDIEFAFEGDTLSLLQSRPITTL